MQRNFSSFSLRKKEMINIHYLCTRADLADG